MMVRKTILNNGVRIVSKKMPHVRSVSMGVWVNVGARDEKSAESGLSHFIEHMIFKGTCKRSAYQIAKEFDAIGGYTNAFTSMESTCYQARVMDTQLETMIDILSDIFLNSIFDEREIEKERPIVFQEIGMVEDSPEEYIHILSEETLWGEHPLGRSILGARENILAFNADTIKEFFRRFYQPERIVIAFAGNLEHDKVVDLIGPAFENIPVGKSCPGRTTPEGQSKITACYRELEQVHLCIETLGLPITDPRRYAFSLLNTILGGNMSSRLFQEIRERLGMAYSVYSFISPFVDTGSFGVYAGVATKNVKKTTRVILDELRRLKMEPVDESELNSAKEHIKGGLLLSAESADNQMVRLAQNEIHLNRYYTLKNIVEKIEAVTPEDIFQLSNSLFGSNQLTLTLLGPVSKADDYSDVLCI